MAEKKNGKEHKARRVRKHTHSLPLCKLDGMAKLDAAMRRLQSKTFGLRSYAALDFLGKQAGGLVTNITLPPAAAAYAARMGYIRN